LGLHCLLRPGPRSSMTRLLTCITEFHWGTRTPLTYYSEDNGDRGRTTIECTPMLKAIALDAVTGKAIWRFDPFEGTEERARDVNRGVAYWEDAKLIPTFGENGSVDLTKEMDASAV